MKRLVISILTLALVHGAFAQKKHKEPVVSTSKVIKSLSYYWRLDSLANNGFRLYSVDGLFKSKLDTVSKQFLLTNFGKPNEVRNTEYGLQLIYYYVDPLAMPKNINALSTRETIVFIFPPTGEQAVGFFQSDTAK